MSDFTQSGFVALKTQLLIGILIAIPVGTLMFQMEKASAATDRSHICVAATLKSNPSIVSYQGNCPDRTAGSTPQATVTPTPTQTPTLEPSPVATPNPTATPSPEPTSTSSPALDLTAPTASPTVEPTLSPEPTPTAAPTLSPTPVPTQTVLPEPTQTPVPTVSATPTPTPIPDVVVSPTPIATSPVVPPAPDPIPIPPANTDPKTKSFMFCHNGGMLSNSYTGMLSGHHGNHPEDIIPPIPFKFYGGWNWTSENAKTFYNNCVPVK